MKEYDISVVVCTYNSSLQRIIETLSSIICQVDICVQIVIADDGSTNNHFEEIETYLKKMGYYDYRLVANFNNQGTVANFFSGLKVSTGRYVKGIGPGDCLYHSRILRSWIDYLEESNADWSFSEALYYKIENDTRVLVKAEAYPNDLTPYVKKSEKLSRWNYVVLDDIALGATMLCKRELQTAYCEKILGKVIYAEDNIWRMMMFDGKIVCYYPEYTVLYEYGTGISTSKKNFWTEKLKRDWDIVTNMLIKTAEPLDGFQKKMIGAIIIKDNPFLRIFIKGKVKKWFLNHFARRMTNDSQVL